MPLKSDLFCPFASLNGRPNGMNGRTIKGKYSFSACPHGYACVHTFCLRHKGETFPRGNHPTATVHLESIVFCRHKQCNWHTFTRKPRLEIRKSERKRKRPHCCFCNFALITAAAAIRITSKIVDIS